MRNCLIPCLVAGLSLALSGCLSLCNTFYLYESEGGGRIYGGVQFDIKMFREGLEAREQEKTGSLPEKNKDKQNEVIFAAIDFPFSLVLDTAALPITVSRTVFWAALEQAGKGYRALRHEPLPAKPEAPSPWEAGPPRPDGQT